MELELLTTQWPWILAIVAAASLGIAALVNEKLNAQARRAVAAVYRVAIHLAAEYGIEWLRSEEGIRFRRELAERTYDALPDRIGPVPVGLIKLVVSRERWCELVEAAFQDMVELARKLETE